MINNFNMEGSSKEYLGHLLNSKMPLGEIGQALKKKQGAVQSSIAEGDLKISSDQQEFNKGHRKEVNMFDTNHKGFFFSSDPIRNAERLEVFKKIRQQYSSERTANVVRQIQSKVKEWSTQQEAVELRKAKSRERKSKAEQQVVDRMRRFQVERAEAERQARKEEVSHRLRLMQEKRQERQQLLKESSLRTHDLSSPKYRLIEQQFSELQKKIAEQRKRVLQEKRKAMMVSKQEIEAHAKQYEEKKKLKEQERQKKARAQSPKPLDARASFHVFSTNNRQRRQQEQIKRSRIKDFQNHVKSLTLIRSPQPEIKTVSNPEPKQIKEKVQQKEETGKKKYHISENADGKQLGKQYLKELRSKTKKQKIQRSQSLPVLQPYRNYLTELKLRRPPVGNQIDQLRRAGRNPQQVLQILHKKSSLYEENALRKINELKKVRRYDESVIKESQIDDLYTRSIKVKLACVNL